MKNFRKTYIAYKAREFYPATNKTYWSQKLEGPYSDGEATDVWTNLRDAGRNIKDVRILKET